MDINTMLPPTIDLDVDAEPSAWDVTLGFICLCGAAVEVTCHDVRRDEAVTAECPHCSRPLVATWTDPHRRPLLA